jgi:hypothetical protein
MISANLTRTRLLTLAAAIATDRENERFFNAGTTLAVRILPLQVHPSLCPD